MSIKWQDINSVNVAEFDAQHKILVGLVNKLAKKKDKKSITEILKDLGQYAAYHFKAEENYFNKFDYPAKDVHSSQHKSFVKKLRLLEKKHNQGKLELPELNDFMGQWWINHINHIDFEYGNFLNQHGVF